MSRKRKALSFKEKLDVLKKVDENPKKKRVDLAKELGLAPSTLCTIVGQRDVILKNVQHFGVNVKQAKTATHVKLEEVLLTWFREVTAAGVNVDGKVLREKADTIALSLGIENFQASGGWLHRFKERHGLVYRVVSGEGKKVDQSAVDEWLNTLPALISEYAPRDIFNADEAGLFFNLQPERSLCVKGQACQGGQKSKERVTVLFCCNSDGSEKLQLTVIGKSKKPRCFRSAERLPVFYKGNRKAWMTGDFFREFLTSLDRKMASRNRKILLFVDQCSAHPKEITLNNVTVRFLPANTTSHLQPLDAGIIRNVKHHFKGLLVRRLLAKIDRKEANLRISLLDALHFLAMSWDNVTSDTISNCFRKCGFAIGLDAASAGDCQEPGEDFTIDGWDNLETEASARDFVTADDNVATCGLTSIEDLVSEADNCGHEPDSDGDADDECDQPPSTADTLHALDVLRRTVSAGSVSDETAARFYAFQAGLVRDINGKKVQASITDFFSRK
ncbi:hypothetical protein V5799_006630 [Amblyomma americanum]|uniref:HTH CENPB-type domain-containing protein n=1 Tax=Amblyomma americanum TaxID=6943 RepID=A0AAQ4DVU8_AMBAM